MDKEKEVAMYQTYRQFLDSGLGLNSSISLDDIVDDNIMGFGTTIDEKILNIGELKELLARQKQQSNDIDLRWDVKPLSHYTSADENTAFFADEIFLYANVGGESIAMYLRFSVVLNYVRNQWKVIHWHGSKPEHVQSNEDTFGIENWKQKAQVLEKLVEERTADLVVKNRELEIEASLERVRAVAMGMKKPDDILDICKIMFTELQSLGFPDLRNTLINFWDDAHDLLIDYDYSDYAGGNKAKLAYSSHPVFQQFQKKIKKSKDAFAKLEVKKDQLESWKQRRRESGEYDDPRLNNINGLYYYFYSIGVGAIGISTFSSLTREKLDLLKRFRNVFDLAYRRYKDIEKAEAQSKEAQIELALERVRARTMAMQRSDELMETAAMLFDQLRQLGEHIERTIIGVMNEEERIVDFWATRPDGSQMDKMQTFPIDEPIVMRKVYDAWRQQKKSIVIDLRGEELESYFQFLKARAPRLKRESFGERRVENFVFFSKGMLGVISADPTKPANVELYERFATVFDQTYTRFLDLQKAEAQAREARIETALEKVRSRSLAMHNSDELQEVVNTVFEKLQELDIEMDSANIAIFKEGSRDFDYWVASDFQTRMASFHIPYTELPLTKDLIAARESGTDYSAKAYSLEEKNQWFNYAFSNTDFKFLTDERKQFILDAPAITVSIAFSKYTGVQAIRYSTKLLSEGEVEILKRFSRVFEQAYTRFLDLQHSEANAREAQIEAALERVRSRTMAMHRSSELLDVVNVVSEQLAHLNFRFDNVSLGINNQDYDIDFWMAAKGQPRPLQIHAPYIDNPLVNRIKEARKKKLDFFTDVCTPEENRQWIWHTIRSAGQEIFSEQTKAFLLNSPGYSRSTALMENINFFIGNYAAHPYSDEENAIFRRFANVIGQSYTRFLDLQKAEAQAREAQIEVSLERVRSKAIAMQKSEDLANAVAIVFEELEKLNLGMLRCGIGILNKEKRSADVWTTTKSDNDTVVQVSGDESMDIHPLLQGAFDAWLNQTDHNYILKGEDLNNYYKALTGVNFKLPDSQSLVTGAEGIQQYYYNAIFSSGGLFAFGETEFSEEAKNVLKRFADVFNLTYIRFNDLRQAEAQAREAKIETALERVRSRTLAMQNSNELTETAAVFFKQLINLGIAPNRLYIGIVKDDDHIEFWVTDEDGSKVSTQFIGDVNGNASMKKMYDEWKDGRRSLTIDMHGKDLENYLHYLADELKVPFKDGLEQKRRVQTIAYFGKGFIGMASPDEQPEETTKLLERFAAVFNLTFTRFNDLKIAEAHAEQAELDLLKLKNEKKRTEEALAELQVTQKQLIQSEKMASLGELTAGVAHEIQNPLNFVNNFSEVSSELLDEMMTELSSDNKEGAMAIADDVKQNLQKILHHGKRADGIVKGMLQHSRASSATKEPTDINKLADEYLRLAYHGLRAKDKSFNATMKTDYDENIGNINIIPQDIGRVILNLITNAFYAVTERKKQKGDDYEPTVSVSTKKLADNVEIRVADNGNGISQKVLEKIFQPFFTTKPTGQGTGLGLSLSYDIIKAHGGELKVETKEGEFAEFIISIPFPH